MFRTDPGGLYPEDRSIFPFNGGLHGIKGILPELWQQLLLTKGYQASGFQSGDEIIHVDVMDSNVLEGRAFLTPAHKMLERHFAPLFNPGMAMQHLPKLSLEILVFGSANSRVVSLMIIRQNING